MSEYRQKLPTRKPNRLPNYDYSAAGYYFVTVCTKGKETSFWNGSLPRLSGVGADIIRPPLPLSQLGQTVKAVILDIPMHYPNVQIDQYVVMPNHVHLILVLTDLDGRMISAPTKGLSTIIGQMKRTVSRQIGRPIWQRSFHDHVIRSEEDYLRIWQYIDTNPLKWEEDCYYDPQ